MTNNDNMKLEELKTEKLIEEKNGLIRENFQKFGRLMNETEKSIKNSWGYRKQLRERINKLKKLLAALPDKL
ncbi:MAG: hypothetical protein MUO31_01375 [Thermodesulfovibrionales bacterium]|nr:hypothetical protein [Thermodesulfovibrionales bacterium]